MDVYKRPKTPKKIKLTNAKSTTNDQDIEQFPEITIYDNIKKRNIKKTVAVSKQQINNELTSSEQNENNIKKAILFEESNWNSGVYLLGSKQKYKIEKETGRTRTMFVNGGTLDISIDNNKMKLQSGSIFYIPANKECLITNNYNKEANVVFFTHNENVK